MPLLSLRGASIGLASLVGLYAVMLGALLTPDLQRFALYAHKFNTLFIHDLDQPEQFGFAKGQVTQFRIRTPDGEILYAWHILPVDVYARNERVLIDERAIDGPIEDFTNTKAFELVRSSDAKVVVSYLSEEVHGNAGHVAQGWRPDTYRYVTSLANTHVITMDYRGFGKSTGHPTEAGLITDGATLVSWAMNTARIPAHRIALLGQSLGTAVASAVALRFAAPDHELLPPREVPLSTSKDVEESVAFAGIILVAPFSSLPSLLLTYRMGGFIPILLPLRPFPALASRLTSLMVDKWPSAERLSAYYSIVSNDSAFQSRLREGIGSVQLFHALNDLDISYHQTEMICQRMLGNDAVCIDGSTGPAVLDVRGAGRPSVRFEILGYGGHNRVITYSNIAAAIVRVFDHCD